MMVQSFFFIRIAARILSCQDISAGLSAPATTPFDIQPSLVFYDQTGRNLFVVNDEQRKDISGFLVLKRLKLVTQCELHHAWIAGQASKAPETCFRVQIEINALIAEKVWPAIKIHFVRNVECFPAELDFSLFR